MSRAADSAYTEIRRLILTGEVEPGAQLRETQLATLCGVSRTPVRDALRRLETDLFVVRSDTHRIFVADWKRTDVEEMFTLRGMLEAHAAARAAARIDAAGLAALHVENARIECAVTAIPPDVSAFIEANRAFHRIIIDAAQSERLTNMLVALVEQPIIRRTAMQYDRAQLAQSAHDHAELIQALAARDSEWARMIMSSHIRRAFHAFTRQPPLQRGE